jgi:hypothetical protein
MLAVVLAICDIINNVNTAGNQTENKKRLDFSEEIILLEEVSGKNERGEKKEILHPLRDPKDIEESSVHEVFASVS